MILLNSGARIPILQGHFLVLDNVTVELEATTSKTAITAHLENSRCVVGKSKKYTIDQVRALIARTEVGKYPALRRQTTNISGVVDLVDSADDNNNYMCFLNKFIEKQYLNKYITYYIGSDVMFDVVIDGVFIWVWEHFEPVK